jgi:hypothetical protein
MTRGGAKARDKKRLTFKTRDEAMAALQKVFAEHKTKLRRAETARRVPADAESE